MLPVHRVLIADDDREVRIGMADLLGGMGLFVLQAESGMEALEVFRRHHPRLPIDLMVLDFHMPGCTGLEVLTNVRAQAQVPCIFYSGNATREIERAALQAGALTVLHKPVQPALFRSSVLRALGMSPR